MANNVDDDDDDDDDDDLEPFEEVTGLVSWRGRQVVAEDYADRIVDDFLSDRTSVDEFLQICRSYSGPRPHFLFTYSRNDDNPQVIDLCLRTVREDKMYELLQALVDEHPDVLTLPNHSGGLLYRALVLSSSRRIHLLLAVSGATRVACAWGMAPLYRAVRGEVIHPDVVHRLIDLDPDVLTHRNLAWEVPLHWAFGLDPARDCVQRMIDVRPETVCCRDLRGETPVECVMHRLGGAPPGRISTLQRLVAQHSRSVALPDTEWDGTQTSLMVVCDYDRANTHPDLVRAVLEAYPPALVIPQEALRTTWEPEGRLPFEAATNNIDKGLGFVKDETIHMALAVIEYALGSLAVSALAVAGDDADGGVATNVAWFQRHIQDTIRQFFPGVQVAGATGLSVAQALLHRGRDDDNGSILLDFVSSLFCHDRVLKLLYGEARQLRGVLLGETVVDLYRMNRQGRYVPIALTRLLANDANDVDNPSAASALHQVELLASLRDSTSVESTFLQFREVAHHSFGSPQSRCSGSIVEEPNATKKRKRASCGTGVWFDTPEDVETTSLRSSKRRSQ